MNNEKCTTKHLRKTLSPVWNESISFLLADGQDVAQKYFKTRKTDAAAAQRLVTLEFQLMDWDPTGNESIGFVNLEVYALMDKIARPGAAGIEASFPVFDRPGASGEGVRGFDGEATTLTLRFRWEIDEAAAAEREAVVVAAENETRRQAHEIMMLQERALKEKIAEELREKQAALREAFLEQLVIDDELGGDVYRSLSLDLSGYLSLSLSLSLSHSLRRSFSLYMYIYLHICLDI